ncbi:GPI-anchor transamidase [Meloidogyne graminicola]|uniref:GPI-anchor transamidase n=1 Tax=Meloidogyne graminicola TaxID=189291 RepID=A0A8S9ZP76_9BILA|nr:GPI-anchor transamidase [Meloidogyne graminicola]
MLVNNYGLFLFFVSLILLFNYSVNSSFNQFFVKSTHTNNWAVLVCSSRFWFNYRHVSNVLSLYKSLKRLGMPDSNIILMLADNIPCNSRNPSPAAIYNNAHSHQNLFLDDTEVDYRGYEVTAENLVRLLTNRQIHSTPRNKRLLSNSQSNVLIYLTGHGGDGFLKFQDSEELTNKDIADAIETMWQQKRYNELMLIADTCQSESMYLSIYSPNVLATSSSLVGEDSLSHHIDRSIGVYVIDRYAYYMQQFLDQKVLALESNSTLENFVEYCDKSKCVSTVGIRKDLYIKELKNVRVTDFFGARRYAQSFNASDFNFDWSLL